MKQAALTRKMKDTEAAKQVKWPHSANDCHNSRAVRLERVLQRDESPSPRECRMRGKLVLGSLEVFKLLHRVGNANSGLLLVERRAVSFLPVKVGGKGVGVVALVLVVVFTHVDSTAAHGGSDRGGGHCGPA